jgi:hypothetical protein
MPVATSEPVQALDVGLDPKVWQAGKPPWIKAVNYEIDRRACARMRCAACQRKNLEFFAFFYQDGATRRYRCFGRCRCPECQFLEIV